jgi:hypothetical protein
VIDPDHLAVRAPAVTLTARRIAALLLEADVATRLQRAIVPAAIVGRACDGADAARSGTSILVGIDGKIGAASAIHPDASAVKAPAEALVASRVAALLQ